MGEKLTSNKNQIWRFYRNADGTYTIQNTQSKRYLDVEAGNNIGNLDAQPNGTNVQSYDSYNGTNNQRFYVYNIYDSYYLKPVGTNKMIDMGTNNGLVAIWDFGEDFAPQKFDIIKTNIDKLQVGDTNLDGKITISDVTAVQQHLAELEKFTEEQLAVADTNGDGEINIIDATHLQKYLAEFDGIVLGKQAE